MMCVCRLYIFTEKYKLKFVVLVTQVTSESDVTCVTKTTNFNLFFVCVKIHNLHISLHIISNWLQLQHYLSVLIKVTCV